ncbi:hypothetical protein HDU81_002056 [Chytriomyces hyalinus]|nr:hypothetical protein HDU81_002056 [Chytriomyces hyalinus]
MHKHAAVCVHRLRVDRPKEYGQLSRGGRDWALLVADQSDEAVVLVPRRVSQAGKYTTHKLVAVEVVRGCVTVDGDSYPLLASFLHSDAETPAFIPILFIDGALPSILTSDNSTPISQSTLFESEVKDVKDPSKLHPDILFNLSIRIAACNDRILSTNSLDEIALELKNAVNDTVNFVYSIDKPSLARISNVLSNDEHADSATQHQLVAQHVESYVMDKTYEFTYFLVSKHLREKDAAFSEVVSKLQGLDLVQMGVSLRFGASLMQAVKDFSAISILRTPFEKLSALMESIRKLNPDMTRRSASPTRSPTTGSGDVVLSSDVLIPLLVLIIIRSKLQNLPSCLYYMMHFSFCSDVEGGEFGYALATVEAVVEYMTSNAAVLEKTCIENARLWKSILTSDLDALDSFFEGPDGQPLKSQDGSRFIDVRKENGDGLLHFACRNGSVVVVEYLLKKGFNPDSQNYLLECPLHVACKSSEEIQIVPLLTSYNALNSSQDVDGNTPFLVASRESRIEALPLLITSIKCDKAGLNAFHLASSHSTISWLLDHCPEQVNELDDRNLTPILHHALVGNTQIVKTLLFDKSAKVDATLLDPLNQSILHLAAESGDIEMAQAFVDWLHRNSSAALDLEVQKFLGLLNAEGNSAMHVAGAASNSDPNQQLKYLQFIQLLVQIGGSQLVSLKNEDMKFAGDIANEGSLVQDFLDSHVLLERARKSFERDKTRLSGDAGKSFRYAVVSRVVRGERGTVSGFIIKSLEGLELDSIVTSFRILTDFEFLRKQLLLEYPDLILPVFSNIGSVNNAASAMRPGVIIKQLVNRLNAFLKYIFTHPILSHSHLREFLSDRILDKTAIEQSTTEKFESIQETIEYTYPNTIDSMETSLEYYSSITARCVPFAHALNDASQASRKLGMAAKASCAGILQARFQISRMDAGMSELYGDDEFGDEVVGRHVLANALTRVEAVYLKQHIPSSFKLAEHMYDAIQSLQHATSILASRFPTLSQEYKQSQKETATLAASVSRLETLVMSPTASEEQITKLSTVHFEYTEKLKQTQSLASRLNYSDMSLRSEWMHFEMGLKGELEHAVDVYVKNQYRGEVECLDVVQEALNCLMHA